MKATISFTWSWKDGQEQSLTLPSQQPNDSTARATPLPPQQAQHEDLVPFRQRSFLRHPLLFYRLYLVVATIPILAIAILYRERYSYGIWVFPLYGFSISALVAVFDLATFKSAVLVQSQDAVRSDEDDKGEPRLRWMPKLRFLVVDMFMLLYHLILAVTYGFNPPNYYGVSPGSSTMFVVVAILSILACVSHAISAIKEMDARDTTRHFSHIQTSEEATADYRDTEINPSQEDQAQKVVASPEQSQASASAMEQGLLTSAKETSYGTIDKGKRQALVNVDDEQ